MYVCLGAQITISKLAPIFTAVMATVLIGEPLTWALCGFIILAMAGVILVARPPFLMGGHEAWSSRMLTHYLACVVIFLCCHFSQKGWQRPEQAVAQGMVDARLTAACL